MFFFALVKIASEKIYKNDSLLINSMKQHMTECFLIVKTLKDK